MRKQYASKSVKTPPTFSNLAVCATSNSVGPLVVIGPITTPYDPVTALPEPKLAMKYYFPFHN